jgi:hypothetical protein
MVVQGIPALKTMLYWPKNSFPFLNNLFNEFFGGKVFDPGNHYLSISLIDSKNNTSLNFIICIEMVSLNQENF